MSLPFLLLLLAVMLGAAWMSALLLLSMWLLLVCRWPGLARGAVFIAGLPWLVGALAMLSILLPGDPHLEQFLSCHCETSMPTWIHLCPIHPSGALSLWGPAGLLVMLLLPGRLLALGPLLRAPLGEGGGASPVLLDLPRPMVALVGWLRPSLVVDRALWGALTAPEQAAILAHEQGHLDRRDPRVLMLLRLLLVVAPQPLAYRGVRVWLERAESLADEAAARTMGDPLLVASALLRCARLGAVRASTAPAWTGGHLERRVQALLVLTVHERPPRPDVGLVDGLLLAGLATPMLLTLPWLHHQLEHLLNHSL